MALPFIMLAVLFRGIENFKMFDMVNLLTGGGPGSVTEVASITLKREAFEAWRTGPSSAFAIVLFVAVFGLANIYVKALEPGEEPMSDTAYSVVTPGRWSKRIATALVILYAIVTMIPLGWILLTSFKSPPELDQLPAEGCSSRPTLEGYCNLFTTRTRQTPEYIESLGPPQSVCDEIVRERAHGDRRPSRYWPRFQNSLIIAFGSTFLAVTLGTFAAYGFSRFRVPLADDLLFFILSTRMMPPIAVAIPIYLMYREVGLTDTRARHDPALHRGQRQPRGLAAQGLHRRDPARVRGGGDDRRLLAAAGLRPRGAAPGDHRHRRDRDLLHDLRLERVRLRRAAHLRQRPDRAALHPDDHRRGRPRLAGGRRRHHDLPACRSSIFTILLRRNLLRGITFGAVRK